jgi:hypothetical protein
MKEKPMNSTFIPSTELKELSTVELQSKFFQVSQDVERLRQKCGPVADGGSLSLEYPLRDDGPSPSRAEALKRTGGLLHGGPPSFFGNGPSGGFHSAARLSAAAFSAAVRCSAAASRSRA